MIAKEYKSLGYINVALSHQDFGHSCLSEDTTTNNCLSVPRCALDVLKIVHKCIIAASKYTTVFDTVNCHKPTNKKREDKGKEV